MSFTSATNDTLPVKPSNAPVRTILEAVISPFHCLYQDAVEFHTQSRLRLPHSDSESGRLARAALVLYLSAAESLVHQAARELGHSHLEHLVCDPNNPMPLRDVWRLLPAIASSGLAGFADPEAPPWPQFEELLAVRRAWAYPGTEEQRRAYYLQTGEHARGFEPLQPQQIPSQLPLNPQDLIFPRTGLPRDPYALRPSHLDTARGVLDAAIEALNRQLGGALTAAGRHRREPIRIIHRTSERG